MHVLLTGASGFIGRHLLTQLCEAGHTVTVAVQNPSRARHILDAVNFVNVDFTQDTTAESWIDRLGDVDAVINAVGIIRESARQTFDLLHVQAPCALFKACEQVGVKKLIHISALGADEFATSNYHKSKKAADDFLSSLNLNQVIIRPSLVYGPGAASGEFFAALAALPIIPLIGNGQQKIQPIHVDDLSQAILNLLESKIDYRSPIDAVGPSEITYRSLLEKYRSWLCIKPTIYVSIPETLVRGFAVLLQFLPGTLFTIENVKMLLRGNTAAVEHFSQSTEIKPRSLDKALRQFPSTKADRWLASLFFLRPVLRISIGLLWLSTGIISVIFYPTEDSYALLSQFGIEGIFAPLVLYGASLLDFMLGFAILANYCVVVVATTQIFVILLYTILISITLPEFWLHPFGPITKNIPLVVATMLVIAFEKIK